MDSLVTFDVHEVLQQLRKEMERLWREIRLD
jgi:hypothetical protein